MIIAKNTYKLQNRKLNFDVVDDLDFSTRNTCYYFRGGNGFGKTSFLEKMVVPALRDADCHYLYIGQDIRTQLYTLKAFLSILGYKVSETDEYELLRRWVQHGRSARIFILDEFDKYFPDFGFIFDWSMSFIHSYIIVTHQSLHQIDSVANRLELIHVRFELIDFDGTVKHVRVRKE